MLIALGQFKEQTKTLNSSLAAAPRLLIGENSGWHAVHMSSSVLNTGYKQEFTAHMHSDTNDTHTCKMIQHMLYKYVCLCTFHAYHVCISCIQGSHC